MSITSPVIEKHPSGFRLVYEDVYGTDIRDLWQAITTPERLARWMVDLTGEFRAGGTWSVVADGDEPSWATGTVTACEAPRSFTTTWHAVGEDQTELTVTLDDVEGGTRMRLVHTGIRSIFYGAGWQTYLERLASHIAGEEHPHEWHARFAELSPAYEERFGAL
jgi:uncharacterized protein YndB with AHSA1/START domain